MKSKRNLSQNLFYNKISKFNKIRFQTRFILEHFLGKTFLSPFIRRWEKSIQQSIYDQISYQPTKNILSIPTVEDISPIEFKKNYLKKGHPVIIKNGASNWKAIKEWSFEFIKDNYGDQEVILTRQEFLGDKQDAPIKSNLKKVIDGIKNDSKDYARFNPLLDSNPELLKSLDQKWLQKMKGWKVKSHNVLFLGNKGTKTNIHNAGDENLFIQIRGKKRWMMWDQRAIYIINPTVNRGPAKTSLIDPHNPKKIVEAFKYVPKYDFVLEEGDILFTPSYYWHYVENITPTIGIGLRWLNPIQTIKNCSLLANLEIFNTNPSIFTTLKMKKGYDFNHVILKGLNVQDISEK